MPRRTFSTTGLRNPAQYPPTSLTARKVGEWKKAGKKIRDLNTTYPEVVGIIEAQAYASAQRIKNNIRKQVYQDWPDLAESTVASKKKLGNDPRTLIATGAYVNSIKVLPMGANQWAIGIPKGKTGEGGVNLAELGLVHEYGTMDGKIPARPHWRREYRTFQAQVTLSVNAWLATKT